MRITRYHFDLNYKIAILSDIHNKAFDLTTLKKEKVDLILMPGDICSEHLSKEAWEQAEKDRRSIIWKSPDIALDLFYELPNIAPTFYSMGNHESRWNEIDKQIVRESGTVLLDNEFCHINDLVIGGIPSIPKDDSGAIYNNVYKNKGQELIGKMKKEEGRKILLLHTII